MNESGVASIRIQDYPLWERMSVGNAPLSFELEVTARCNNDCRHCYNNLPAGDCEAQGRELSLAEIERIAGEAVSMGALWCLVTGGEPLLRGNFPAIYTALKRKGLLVSVFTNATLVDEEMVDLFRRLPPRDIEVSVYGVTRETYERVTRRSGSFGAFMGGLDRLLEGGLRVRLKAVVTRSNVHELPAIARFCREKTKDYFRFDPLLHLRCDGNEGRNAEIRAERLTPEQIVAIERDDRERSAALQKGCTLLSSNSHDSTSCGHLFRCGAGADGFYVTHDGHFRLCSSLSSPNLSINLRTWNLEPANLQPGSCEPANLEPANLQPGTCEPANLEPVTCKPGTLSSAWHTLAPQVRDMRSHSSAFLENCGSCNLINLCQWCPAHAYLETCELDKPSSYFCEVAHARATNLQASVLNLEPANL